MRLVVQRVLESHVAVEGRVIGAIRKGYLVLVGFHRDDEPESIPWFVNKLINLRIFNDQNGKMNLSIKDVQGEVLVISQFTLYGNCLSGRRPDFLQAAEPAEAITLYSQFVEQLRKEIPVQTGEFGADMQVFLVNDGPVTFLIEQEKK